MLVHSLLIESVDRRRLGGSAGGNDVPSDRVDRCPQAPGDKRPGPLAREGACAGTAERLAFERLARERRSEIKVHCYRMLGSLADAEDMTQETFARAWRARGELTDSAAARAWLYRIATNACLDALRRHKRERRLWA